MLFDDFLYEDDRLWRKFHRTSPSSTTNPHRDFLMTSLTVYLYNGQTRFNGFQVLRGIEIRNVISGWRYNGLLRVKRISEYLDGARFQTSKIVRRRNFNGVPLRSTELPWGSGKSREPGKSETIGKYQSGRETGRESFRRREMKLREVSRFVVATCNLIDERIVSE